MSIFALVLAVYALVECGSDTSSLRLPPNLFLVRARAIKVTPPDESHAGFQRCVFRIEKVYVGDMSLQGKSFELLNCVWYPNSGSGILREATLAEGRVGEIRRGEVGIWPLTQKKHKLVVQTSYRMLVDQGMSWFPFRNVRSETVHTEHTVDRYPFALPWTRAIAKVYHADSDEQRIDLLKHYARLEDSPISSWAIVQLGKRDDQPTVRFLTHLASRPCLSTLGQTTLDQVLAETQGRAWTTSKRRGQLVQRWITKPLPNPADFAYISDRVVSALRDDQLDLGILLGVLQKTLPCPGRLPAGRKKELKELVALLQPSTAKERRQLFDFLIGLIRGSPDGDVRRSAALDLDHCAPFDKRQETLIRKLAKATPDKQLSKGLTWVLDPGEDPPPYYDE